MMSVPRTHAENPSDTIPDASRATIRRALETFLPQHKDKPLFNTALCWCAGKNCLCALESLSPFADCSVPMHRHQ